MTKTLKQTPATLIALLSYLAYSCVYLCRLNLSVASVSIKELGIMNEAELGALSGIFLATYAAGKLFLGRVGDKIPPKNLIVSGLFLCGFANLIFALFPPTPFLYILWMLNGAAQSLIWGPILRIVSSHFEKERRATVLSFLATCIGVGSILGVFAATLGISLFKTVSAAFFVPAAITLFICAVFLIFVHEKEEEAVQKLPPLPLKELLFDPAFRRMALPAFMHGVIKDNINVWMCLFFVSAYNLDLQNLAFYIFLVPLLTLVGRIIYLPVLRLCKNDENLTASISLFLTAVFMIALSTGKLPLSLALVCFGGSACMISMANTTLLSVFPARYLERGCVSSVASYMDVLTYSGAAIGSVVYGALTTNFGYSPMFISWFVLSLLSGILLLYKSRN